MRYLLPCLIVSLSVVCVAFWLMHLWILAVSLTGLTWMMMGADLARGPEALEEEEANL
jgi:hypothetical protein